MCDTMNLSKELELSTLSTDSIIINKSSFNFLF